MSGNAWGADWARYHRERRRKKDQAIVQKKRRRCIYLLYRCHDTLSWFGAPQLVVKAGKSERNALIRFSEQQHKGFHLKAYWDVSVEALNDCENEVLKTCGRNSANRLKVERPSSLVPRSRMSVASSSRLRRNTRQPPNRRFEADMPHRRAAQAKR